MGAQPIETSEDSKFQVEATVSGDFYDPADAPHIEVRQAERPGVERGQDDRRYQEPGDDEEDVHPDEAPRDSAGEGMEADHR